MHMTVRTRQAQSLALALALTMAGLLSPTWGQGPGGQGKAALELATDRTAYEPGSMATLAAKVEIEKHWHTNSHNPTFDYLIATNLELTLPEGWPPAEISYPAGEMKTFAFADKPISVYDDHFAVLARIQIPEEVEAGEWTLDASLRYQACDARSCLPPTNATASIALSIGPGGVKSSDPVFASTETTDQSRPKKAVNLPVILLLGLVGGLILNAMPCVLPVLSLKVFGLVKSAGHGRS